MEIKVIKEPKYQLTLSAQEMSDLWNLLYIATDKGIVNSRFLFGKLEDIRPAGGFKENN